jgi:hypothetical protein
MRQVRVAMMMSQRLFRMKNQTARGANRQDRIEHGHPHREWGNPALHG